MPKPKPPVPPGDSKPAASDYEKHRQAVTDRVKKWFETFFKDPIEQVHRSADNFECDPRMWCPDKWYQNNVIYKKKGHERNPNWEAWNWVWPWLEEQAKQGNIQEKHVKFRIMVYYKHDSR